MGVEKRLFCLGRFGKTSHRFELGYAASNGHSKLILALASLYHLAKCPLHCYRNNFLKSKSMYAALHLLRFLSLSTAYSWKTRGEHFSMELGFHLPSWFPLEWIVAYSSRLYPSLEMCKLQATGSRILHRFQGDSQLLIIDWCQDTRSVPITSIDPLIKELPSSNALRRHNQVLSADVSQVSSPFFLFFYF